MSESAVLSMFDSCIDRHSSCSLYNALLQYLYQCIRERGMATSDLLTSSNKISVNGASVMWMRYDIEY